MSDTNETIADIIAHKRQQAAYIVQMAQGKSNAWRDRAEDEARDIRREADRLEAALKREKAAIEADALEVGGIVEAAHRRDSTTPHTGKWLNGKNYEYEFAYCSECGRMLWAGWDSHEEAKENIRDFADYYRYCPECGAKMEGGEYVE